MQFSSHIDSTDLPTMSQSTYSLSLLEGTAIDVVQSVPQTSPNYTTVMDQLKNRFGKYHPCTCTNSPRCTSANRPGQKLYHATLKTLR